MLKIGRYIFVRQVPGIGREGISVILRNRTSLNFESHRVGYILSSSRCCSGSSGWEYLLSSGRMAIEVQVE